MSLRARIILAFIILVFFWLIPWTYGIYKIGEVLLWN